MPYVHHIDPILFGVGGVYVWWYGLGYTLGFLQIQRFLARRHHELGLSRREVWSLSLFVSCGVLIGGRAIEVAFDEWPFYRGHLALIPAYWLGGMATHGLLLGGALASAFFAFRYRKPFLPLADALVIPSAFLMGIGRIGNFIDGQIVGAVTNVWWAVKFPDADGFRHPVVLYDGAKNLLLMALLLRERRVNPTAGAVAARFVFWYAFPRIFIDLFRDYPTHRLALGTGQTLNIVMAILGAALLYRSRLRRLGRLAPYSAAEPLRPTDLDVPPRLAQRLGLAAVLLFCLTLPSNWTQDVPARYGTRHPGLEHSWLYPAIDTSPRSAPAASATQYGLFSVGLARQPSAVEPRSGLSFPSALMPPGGDTPHHLMGLGLRDRTVFRIKIYAYGLYVDPEGARTALREFAGIPLRALERDERFYERVLALDFAMSLRLVMARTVTGSDIAGAFDAALEPRLGTDQPGADPAAQRALETFRQYLRVREVRSGTEIVFACTPDGRLSSTLAGEERPPIESMPLCRALFDVYLGRAPVSATGKRTVIAGFPALLSEPQGRLGQSTHRAATVRGRIGARDDRRRQEPAILRGPLTMPARATTCPIQERTAQRRLTLHHLDAEFRDVSRTVIQVPG